MASIIRKLSRQDYEDDVDPTDLVEAGLYELDSGEIVVAAFGRVVTRKLIENGVRVWELADQAPKSISSMGRIYIDDWFNDGDAVPRNRYTNSMYLFAMDRSFEPLSFDPGPWGGKALSKFVPANEKDPRIVHVVQDPPAGPDRIVVVQLKDVPVGVERGSAASNIAFVIDGSGNTSRIGMFNGPASGLATPSDYTRIRLRDLPAVSAQTSIVIMEEVPPKPIHKHGNSGRTYSFEAGKNPFTSDLGWKPLDLAGDGAGPAFDPVAPVMAVHDLMEHFPGDEYAPHNEYMAQGAMLWLRYEGGFFVGQNMSDAVVKPAFGMLFHHIYKGKLETKELIPVRSEEAVLPFQMPESTYYELNELVFKTKAYITNTFSDSQKAAMLKSVHRGMPWILLGYSQAAERYSGLDKRRLVLLYKNTVEQISKVALGSKLKLTMNYELYTSKIELEASVKG